MEETHAVKGDSPMHRRLFTELTYEEQIAWLEGIRKRRNAAAEKHERMQQMAAAAHDDRLRTKIIKKREQLSTAITRLDAHLEKLDKLITELHVLRLEAGVIE